MFKFTIILFIYLSSCVYPDIDSVPEFNDMSISMQDSIQLCKISDDNNNCSELLSVIISRL